MKYLIHPDIFDQWRWYLASGGERLATGEAYPSRAACEEAVARIKASGAAPVVISAASLRRWVSRK